MNKIDERILAFIKEHHVLTLATTIDNRPWCSNLFYAYHVLNDQNKLTLIFTSEDHTLHAQQFIQNKIVAGTIVLETTMVGKIQGVQFAGEVKKLEGDDFKHAKSIYIKAFPVALLHKLDLWEIDVNYLKFTDNRLGFGKKLIWNKSNEL